MIDPVEYDPLADRSITERSDAGYGKSGPIRDIIAFYPNDESLAEEKR